MSKNVKFDVQMRGSSVSKRTFMEVEEASSSSEPIKKISRNNLNPLPATSTNKDSIKSQNSSNFDYRKMDIFPSIPSYYRETQTGPRIIDTEKGSVLAFFGYYFLFSNFNRQLRFIIDGNTYDCVERYYTYQKALFNNNHQLANEILDNWHLSPAELKRMAKFNEINNIKYQQWRIIKFDIMRTALFAKFTQNPKAKNMLLETGTSLLIEASYDVTWGVGCNSELIKERQPTDNINNWIGQNKLGVLLMELREQLNK
uniref:NADAR domain-containing protein n=1 Tax=Meloidogyne incognita TaxID=6306 RepID=A0A914KSE3_MELIC